MEELLKSNFFWRGAATAFVGLWVLYVTCGTFVKTKKMTDKMKKTLLRFGVSSALIFFWVYVFVYMYLYPISLAYYEYNYDLAEETIGVIDSIEQKSKDRIHLIVDNQKYIIVHNSVTPFVNFGKDIVEGDTVKIRFGENSKYIFDIYESDIP